MARVVGVNVSVNRTDPKISIDRAELRVHHGLVGDSHAGLSEREVSLLALETIAEVNREYGIGAIPGSFAENLTLEGLDLMTLHVGDRLRVGQALLEVVQIGKPADAAHTYNFRGVSALPRQGVFCRVVRGGVVCRGDALQVLPREEP